MAFGRWPLTRFPAVTRRGFVAAVLALFVAGCGGGGGGSNSGTATVTGRVVNLTTGSAVTNATVTYGGQSQVTGSTGAFTFSISGAAPAQPLKVSAADYRDQGLHNNRTVRVASEGISVAAVAAGETVDLGTIFLSSTEDPPPPPPI